MKILVTLLLVGSLAASAQGPRKEPLNKYSQLWENSLVTEKPDPPVTTKEQAPNQLDDYVLGGWTQTSQGYLVSLINSKNPKDRLTIAPAMPNKGGFQVLDVKRDPFNYKASEVLVQVGSDQKWIGYEEKFLTLQQPAAAQQTRNQAANQQAAQRAAQQRNGQQRTGQSQPPIPNLNQTNQNNQQNSGQPRRQRQPRVRRVPVPPKN